MTCPFCRNEMESGFVQSKSGIIYTAKEKTLAVPIRRKGDIRLTTNPIAPATCGAWHCRSCRKVFIDYTQGQIKA